MARANVLKDAGFSGIGKALSEILICPLSKQPLRYFPSFSFSQSFGNHAYIVFLMLITFVSLFQLGFARKAVL